MYLTGPALGLPVVVVVVVPGRYWRNAPSEPKQLKSRPDGIERLPHERTGRHIPRVHWKRPSAALSPASRAVVLGVVEEIVRSALLDKARLVESAALPFRSLAWDEARRFDLPTAEVAAPAKSDHGGTALIPRVRVGVIDAKEMAADLAQIPG